MRRRARAGGIRSRARERLSRPAAGTGRTRCRDVETRFPYGASGVERVRIITQITRSLVGLSGIERVWLRNDGAPWGLWRMEGGISNRPYDYDAMLGWSHVCAAKPGTEAVPDDCVSALP